MKPHNRERESSIGLPLEVTPIHRSIHDDSRDSGSAASSSTAPDSTSTASPQNNLEERVQELEEKLATLSLLLLQQQQQQRRGVQGISPSSMTPPPSPPQDGSSYLALESPAACRPPSHRNIDRRRRNLSFRVLHSPDSPQQDKDMSDLTDSMFLPEGLPEEIHEEMAFQTKCVSPSRPETEDFSSPSHANKNISTKAPSSKSQTVRILSPTKDLQEEKADHDKSKWLDYLNSFQESHYDTDKQMEEFVKIPSAVEALLSFGFWICVDSFLYILTILPIRFVWSSLLLVRFLAIRMVQKKVPDGPFRFHRR